jgi:hypothetical protein
MENKDVIATAKKEFEEETFREAVEAQKRILKEHYGMSVFQRLTKWWPSTPKESLHQGTSGT